MTSGCFRIGCKWKQADESNDCNAHNEFAEYDLSTSIPPKCCTGSISRQRLKKLGEMTMSFYQGRAIHALHVYSTALKSVLKDEIMNDEHMMPITNSSGPPNVGKTFASAIALRMRATDDLMLSRVTPSSLL